VIGALAWVTLLSPLAASLVILFGTWKSRMMSGRVAVGGMGLSFLSALITLTHFIGGKAGDIESTLSWVSLPGLSLEFGLHLDSLEVLMTLVVTGVGLLIFIYSMGYMSGEPGFSRYFAYLSLFAFSMLGIVLANNFVTLFMFWELVGASSYLLIGYWYDRPRAADAGKKAFLVNRIADFGFLIGILMLWTLSGLGGESRTLNFLELEGRIRLLTANGALSPTNLSLIGLLIFCGVMGKSAQFPLHVWLPDAMEGPTPVSALIHAATMVAAGVYMLCRVFFLFAGLPHVLDWIAWIGAFTSIFAASLALVENDIKRILAYSTLSQLGYMVMALGLGGYTAGMYHLSTHAFFKALLFMGAGCVIHGLHTNDIREMGGLFRAMPVTSKTFLVGMLALCGIFPFSGFWSKDEILTLAFTYSPILWTIGTATAGMTAFYMGRLWTVAFLGEPRSHKHHAQSAETPGAASFSRSHEAPATMTGPLVVLALLSVFGGLGLPGFIGHVEGSRHLEFNWIVAVSSSLAAIAGLTLAYGLYQRKWQSAPGLLAVTQKIRIVLARKYFIDEIYAWINQNVQQRLAVLLGLFERYVIIGLWANGIAKTTGLCGNVVRRSQSGKVQAYALTFLAGLALLIYLAAGWQCIR